MQSRASWQRLRQLELSLAPADNWDLLSADTVAAALSSLRSLLVLTLSRKNLDPVLTHVHRIPALRRLIIQCHLSLWSNDLPHSDAAVLSLLRLSPALCVEWLTACSLDSDQLKSKLQPLAAKLGAQLIHTEETLSYHSSQSRFRLVRAE